MSEGRSTTKQVPCDCVTEEELALDKLVNVIRLRYPSTTWERLTCDGRPFVHVGDDYGDVEIVMMSAPAANTADALRTAKNYADSYMTMALAAVAIMGG